MPCVLLLSKCSINSIPSFKKNLKKPFSGEVLSAKPSRAVPERTILQKQTSLAAAITSPGQSQHSQQSLRPWFVSEGALPSKASLGHIASCSTPLGSYFRSFDALLMCEGRTSPLHSY